MDWIVVAVAALVVLVALALVVVIGDMMMVAVRVVTVVVVIVVLARSPGLRDQYVGYVVYVVCSNWQSNHPTYLLLVQPSSVLVASDSVPVVPVPVPLVTPTI